MKYRGQMRQSIYADMFEEQEIMRAYRGSKAHGMYIPPTNEGGSDDIDTISVYRFPIQYYLTLPGYHHSRETHESLIEEFDHVAYEIRKMFNMMQQINPNVISTLFLRKEDFLNITPAWEMIMENRDIFQAKVSIKNAFGGYAYAQLKKMTTDQKYMGYMGHKRKGLVDQYGYDTKNASHLIRLLRMGIEYLRDGEPQVYRQDAKELIAIKTGRWTIEQVMNEANKLFDSLENMYEKSKLPNQNNSTKINKLLYEVMNLPHQEQEDRE